MSERIRAMAILVEMIANLSVRMHPPHDTIRNLQKNLDTIADSFKEEPNE